MMEFLYGQWDSVVNEASYMVRLAVACVCGCVIGVERSFRQKEAGIRTHIVVAIGAALSAHRQAHGEKSRPALSFGLTELAKPTPSSAIKKDRP